MAHFHVKTKKGRPYLYVREIARVQGRPKVVSQIYIGGPERVRELASGGPASSAMTLKVQEFGSLFAASQMDAGIDFAGIVDAVVPRAARETGPSVGEYFWFAALNRMVDAHSKRALPEWYAGTAVQEIRPVAIDELTSQRYWQKWNRVSERDLEEIAKRFFARVWELESPPADCLLFDTTNYYTFMASDTESDLARRGKNKEGRHNLRQVGLALMVARESRLPLYYSVYPGNRHDSKEFGQIMDEMFGVACGLNRTKERLTVVIDKGMNSEENFAWIDEHPRGHFVTTYSPYFAQDLATTPLEQFSPVSNEKNTELERKGHPEERLLAYRTQGEYWGKARAVVVTHNPATARKQEYTFESKLDELRDELLAMRAKVREGLAHWRDPETIQERHVGACERLHLSSEFYGLEFSREGGKLTMSFQKDHYRIEQKRKTFGKNIIITDNTDWSTEEIVAANIDRWEVEDCFRLSKDDDLAAVQPIRHWTDSKILCHLLTCVVAMTYLRRLELRLRKKGIKGSAASAMASLRRLHSVLSIEGGARKPRRRIETPAKTQAEVLSALGHRVDPSGVLQSLPS